jgi:hypothetical protein
MTLASALITRLRSKLDDPSAAFFSDTDLLAWINEGMRDAGRRTRHIRDVKTVNVTGGVSEYTLTADVIEIEMVSYLPGDGRVIPLLGQSYEQMSNVWGSFQNQRVGEPQAFAPWGTPPNLKIKLYPSPEASSSPGLSLLVRRMPAVATTTASNLDWPEHWDDLIEDYAEMCALRKARDPRWQEAFAMYTSKRDNLDVNGQYESMPDTFIFDGRAGVYPRWLVESE